MGWHNIVSCVPVHYHTPKQQPMEVLCSSTNTKTSAMPLCRYGRYSSLYRAKNQILVLLMSPGVHSKEDKHVLSRTLARVLKLCRRN